MCTKFLMVGRVDENLLVKLLDLIPNENTSVHQLCCKTSIDHRTIKKYVQLIIYVQAAPKLKLDTVGLRVLVRKENAGTLRCARDPGQGALDAGLHRQDAY